MRPAAVALLCLLTVAVVAGAQVTFLPSRQSMPTVDYNSHFAFTRIRYGVGRGLVRRFNPNDGWAHDYPTADRNLSAILDYITNMRVRLDGGNILDLDDPRIFENPIIYMSEPGFWTTTDDEAANLRAYLLKGGFIIFDDFDGAGEWQNLVTQMRRALPDHHFLNIDISHPIFHSFFGIKLLNIPHPYVNAPPDYLAIFDNNDRSGRMMALANYNNDLGDYWEWSAEGLYGTDPTNDAYRLGVNYIVYAMTH